MNTLTIIDSSKRSLVSAVGRAPHVLAMTFTMCAGCVSYQIEEPSMCKTNTLVYQRAVATGAPPPDPDAAQDAIPLVSNSVVNLSDVFGTLSELGDVEFGVTENRLTGLKGDFSWIREVSIEVAPADEASDMPPMLISVEQIEPGSTSQEFRLLVDSDDILPYIEQGQVKFVVTMTPTDNADVPEAFEVNHTFCASATVTGEKQL